MTSILKYIDYSTNSIIAFVLVFVSVFFISKYIFETYKEENDEDRIHLLYSFIIAIALALLSLVVIKIVKKPSYDTLKGPFITTSMSGHKRSIF